jgi:hypothetical protein
MLIVIVGPGYSASGHSCNENDTQLQVENKHLLPLLNVTRAQSTIPMSNATKCLGPKSVACPLKISDSDMTAKFILTSFTHAAMQVKRRHVTPELATSAVPKKAKPRKTWGMHRNSQQMTTLMLVNTRNSLTAKEA